MTLSNLQHFLSEHQATIVWLAGVSVTAFFVSIIVLPLVLIRLPADYFVMPPHIPEGHPVTRIILKILKNLLGILLLLLGFVMLFIPGQGILTILFGLALMDFPGKWELQGKMARAPRVHRSLDWLRQKTNQPLFILPDPPQQESASSPGSDDSPPRDQLGSATNASRVFFSSPQKKDLQRPAAA